MNVKKQISIISLERLGSRIYPGAVEWDEVVNLARVHGRDEVINCFREWADKQSLTEVVPCPLKQFLKTAPAVLAGKTAPAVPQQHKVLPCWQYQMEQRIERLEKLVQQLQVAAQ